MAKNEKRLRHPREVEILNHLASMKLYTGNRRVVENKTEQMLNFFAEHGRLPERKENRLLYAWVSSTRGNAAGGRASKGMVDLLNMFGANIPPVKSTPTPRKTKVIRPGKTGASPVPPLGGASGKGEMRLSREAQTELSKLAPAGFISQPGEDPGETVWWLRLWQWLELKDEKPDAQLRAFIRLQPRLIAEQALSKRQLSLVEMLRGNDRRKKPD